MTSAFKNQAIALLQMISAQLESSHPQLEVEETQEALEITLPNGRIFLVTLNAPLQQIWLSSPVSGAHHYAFDGQSKRWLSTRIDQDELLDRLSGELSSVINQTIRIKDQA